MRWHWDEHQGTKRDAGIRECERGTVPSLDLPKYGEDDSSPSELTQDEDHPVFLLPTRTQGCTLVNTFYWVARTGQNLHSTPTSGNVTNSLLEASFCYKIERAEKQRFPPPLVTSTYRNIDLPRTCTEDCNQMGVVLILSIPWHNNGCNSEMENTCAASMKLSIGSEAAPK